MKQLMNNQKTADRKLRKETTPTLERSLANINTEQKNRVPSIINV